MHTGGAGGAGGGEDGLFLFKDFKNWIIKIQKSMKIDDLPNIFSQPPVPPLLIIWNQLFIYGSVGGSNDAENAI